MSNEVQEHNQLMDSTIDRNDHIHEVAYQNNRNTWCLLLNIEFITEIIIIEGQSSNI